MKLQSTEITKKLAWWMSSQEIFWKEMLMYLSFISRQNIADAQHQRIWIPRNSACCHMQGANEKILMHNIILCLDQSELHVVCVCRRGSWIWCKLGNNERKNSFHSDHVAWVCFFLYNSQCRDVSWKYSETCYKLKTSSMTFVKQNYKNE